MRHPFELIELMKTNKYKEPKQISNEEYISSKDKINPLEQTINNLNQNIHQINEVLKPLQQEYEREMQHRKNLQNMLNSKNDEKTTSFFKKRKK